eukprot:8944029-Karenia_brevis.AAC.1
MAASEAEVDECLAEEVFSVDALARKVLMRLIDVGMAVAQGCEGGRLEMAPREPQAAKRTPADLLELARSNGHVMQCKQSVVTCKRCKNRASKPQLWTTDWLHSICDPSRPPVSFHVSHRPLVVIEGKWICRQCGGQSSGTRVCKLGE